MPEVPAPAELFHFAVTLVLTFVLGLEREETADREHARTMAGVRTMPLVGLLGHMLSIAGGGAPLLPAIGFVLVGGLTVVSYAAKLRHERTGTTTELTVLLAYTIGLLSAHGDALTATAVTVAAVLLLTGKQPLRSFARRIPPQELTTFVTFLLLLAVILPVLPHEDFTRFRLNPFNTWLVVVAVSAISYASYLLQKLVRSEESLLLTALLGGLYSSTATTVSLARRSHGSRAPRRDAGAIILATGTMYIRILTLVWTFSSELGRQLAPSLLSLAAIGSLAGVALVLRGDGTRANRAPLAGDVANEESHPLELRAAVLFAALFLGLQVITQLTQQYLGDAGLLALAGLVGLTDIVPFILGLADTLTNGSAPPVVVLAIMLSIASNNVVKGIYALWLGERETGIWSLVGLSGLAALTVAAAFVLP
ncbi:MAG: MgtC/SapB family protein [Deltaproteobacteria bacterium]|nr:MgtC/SapB family protein [Deltaproteobacteria bacterium]